MAATAGAISLLVASAAPTAAQDTLYFPRADHVAVRDLRTLPPVALSDQLRIRTIVGPTGSVSYGELDSGAVAPLHHHTREQGDLTLTGQLNVLLDGRAHSLGPGEGVIIPIDVTHSVLNPGPGRTTALEFHTVPRADLVPPRPSIAFPVAATPVAYADAGAGVIRLDAAAGAVLQGATCSVRWRWVDTPVDVHPASTPTELFIYIARGAGELATDGRTIPLREGVLVVLPARLTHARVTAVGGRPVALIEFHPGKP
jgi:quercetin dioxygenase-like cupin family protein